MSKFFIKYQLEDEAPEFVHIQANGLKNAIVLLQSKLKKHLLEDGLLEEEAEQIASNTCLLEVREI